MDHTVLPATHAFIHKWTEGNDDVYDDDDDDTHLREDEGTDDVPLPS